MVAAGISLAPVVSAAAAQPTDAPSDSQRTVEITDPSLARSPQMRLEGTLAVYARESDGPGPESSYRLTTTQGTTLEVTGDIPSEVRTGSRFVGNLALPEAPALRADAASGTVPLEIATATIEPPAVAATVTSGVHTLNIAVVAPLGQGANFISDSAVDALVASLNTYWASQSIGIISAVKRVGSILHYQSSANCDPSGLWKEAAAKFGKTGSSYWSGTTRDHLVVLSPDSCGGGTGLGTLGSGSGNGGQIWGAMNGHTNLQVVAHEFGHNIGLDHSNVHACPSATMVEGAWDASSSTFSDGCRDKPYADYFDLMAGGTGICSVTGCQYTSALPALNATHKKTLGFYPGGSLVGVALPAGASHLDKTFTLQAASATSGVRALEVTDPRSGGHYFAEYRSGTGIDAAALYAAGDEQLGLGIGLRVLEQRSNRSSAVLQAVPAAGEQYRQLYLRQGGSLAGRSGGVTFTAVGIGTTSMTVRVQLAGTGASSPAKNYQPSSTATVTAEPATTTTVTRISGLDRYATAVAVSRAGYPSGAPVVYVATGANYPDALAAAPAAAMQGGPLLLTAAKTLPSNVAQEILRLKPAKLVVVGGTGVVSSAVFSRLKSLVPGTVRIGGVDRFDTARKVIRSAFSHSTLAYIATGMNYPDALSASAAAGSVEGPVVLVRGSTLDSPTRTLLRDLGVTKTIIAGGRAVVSSGIETALRSFTSVKRYAGTDRFDTSRLINNGAFPTAKRVFLATGYQFPDALSGAALAAATASPLFVVKPTCIPAATSDEINSLKPSQLTLVGGTGALSKAVAAGVRC